MLDFRLSNWVVQQYEFPKVIKSLLSFCYDVQFLPKSEVVVLKREVG